MAYASYLWTHNYYETTSLRSETDTNIWLDPFSFEDFEVGEVHDIVCVYIKCLAVQVDMPDNSIKMSGADLFATFTLSQFHFHWGPDDTTGSEHTVNGKSYPLEVRRMQLFVK